MLPAHHRDLVRRALAALGIDRLVLAIHDASFPGEPGDDPGRGSPASRGGARLCAFARDLGFDAIQLGPAGQTSESNASPYDGTAFSRNVLSIALRELTEPGPFGALLDPRTLAEIAEARPAADDRAHHAYAFRAQDRALREAFARYEAGGSPALRERATSFLAENAAWIEREVLYDALSEEHGAPYFKGWMEGGAAHPDQRLWERDAATEPARAARRRAILARHGRRLEEHVFRQVVAHEQHAEVRGRARALGLDLYGDLQIGFSAHDVWAYQAEFLRDFLMGAPPSRTNPDGQPWGYPVLDPAQVFVPGTREPGAALRLLSARMDKMFAEFDGVRIDHPHGLVCPWVYRADDPDPQIAVQRGARLFSSPDLPDHPGLARFSIVRPDQIQRDVARYAEDRVRDLSASQVERYGVLFDAIIASARRHGRDPSRLVCEVLSTMPRPLSRVLAAHGLGRFRVVQKASLEDARDVYRTENARPEDWVMLGTHDTKPAFRVAGAWAKAPIGERWAEHLASRLAPRESERGAVARSIREGGAGALVHALFADMAACEARNIMIFFGDLFGLVEAYNTPGTVGEENWSLRLTPDFDRRYLERVARGEALSLPRALAMALRARGGDGDLAAALDALAIEITSPGRSSR
jgi:4-alpha-glucanotransferase